MYSVHSFSYSFLPMCNIVYLPFTNWGSRPGVVPRTEVPKTFCAIGAMAHYFISIISIMPPP